MSNLFQSLLTFYRVVLRPLSALSWVFMGVTLLVAPLFSAFGQCFQPTSNPSPQNSYGLATGDMNGDGRPDLVSANESGSNSVSVFLNAGGGTFSAPVNYTVGTSPYGVALADVDSDGDLDVLTPADNENKVYIRPNNGNGTLGASTTLGSIGNSPSYITVGDFNKDGKPDMAVANASTPGDGFVSILLNTNTTPGTISFGPSTTYTTGTGTTGGDFVLTVDFDGDGNVDLATSNTDEGSISILRGNGNGTFGVPIVYTNIGNGPRGMAAADVNKDGKLDLVITAYDDDQVVILRNNGPGAGTISFDNLNIDKYGVGAEPVSVVVGKFDCDDELDLIVVNYDEGANSFLSGTGTGSFGNAVDVAASYFHSEGVVADFNGDGKPDFAVTNGSDDEVTVFANTRECVLITGVQGSSVACEGSSITVTAITSGTTTGFQWYKDDLDSPVGGQTTATLSLTNLDPNDSGEYFLVVTNGCGTFTSQSLTLTVNQAPCGPTVSIVASQTQVCQSDFVSLTAITGGSPVVRYTWRAPAGANLNSLGSQQVQASFTEIGLKTFTVTVSDATNQTATSTITINVIPIPTVVIYFPNSQTLVPVSNGMPTVTTLNRDPITIQAGTGVDYDWRMVIDRINGYEIREADHNSTGKIRVGNRGPYQLTVTGANGCKRTVTGLIVYAP